MSYISVNGAKVLNVTLVSAATAATFISPDTNLRFGLTTFVSNLMVESFSLPLPYCLLFWPLIMYHFLVSNFEDSLSESFNIFTIFSVSIFKHVKQQLQNFVRNKSGFFFFLSNKEHCCIIFSRLPIKFAVLNQDFLIQFACLNLLQLTGNDL